MKDLKSQFNHAISSQTRFGNSKRADNKNPDFDNSAKLYSVQRTEDLRNFANDFAKFMKTEHKEIKLVSKIKTDHMQEFLDRKAKNCTRSTMIEYKSKFEKLDKIIMERYKCNSIRADRIEVPKGEKSKTRTKAMERSDVEKVKASFLERDASTQGFKALLIAEKTGLRAKEVARLSYSSIDLEKGLIHVREGSKGGKFRDVSIRAEDRAFFSDLKGQGEGRIFTVKEDSLNASIRRELAKCGLEKKYINTTIHSIRKLWAKESLDILKNKGMTEKEAWCFVQKELGHGELFRQELYDTYIGG